MPAREQALRDLEIEAAFDLAERDYPELFEAIGQQAVRGATQEATVHYLPTPQSMEDSEFAEADLVEAAELEQTVDPLRALRIRIHTHRVRNQKPNEVRTDAEILRDTTSEGQADKAANHVLLRPAEEILLCAGGIGAVVNKHN